MAQKLEAWVIDQNVADPEAVLVSKACKAPKKNGPLLTEYLAAEPSERFLKLAAKYDVDLEQFL